MTAGSESKAPVWPYVGYALLVLLVFGVIGFVTVAAALVCVRIAAAQAETDKHGVAEVTQSRLGGLAICVGVAAGLLSLSLLGEPLAGIPAVLREPLVALSIVGIGVIGLIEDLRAVHSPRVRLVFLAAASGLAVLGYPSMIPAAVGQPLVDELLALPMLPSAVFVFLLCGFVNAANAADGANGLMGGVLFAAFLGLYLLEPSPLLGHLALAVMAFVIVNVAQGRVFLGDAGCYALSAVLAILCFDAFARTDVSLWYLASLVSYPCLDFLWTIVARICGGRSPLQAGNDHLHNRLYAWLRPRLGSALAANSVTGVSLSMFSVVPLLVALGLEADGEAWLGVYAVLVGVYAAVRVMLGDAGARSVATR